MGILQILFGRIGLGRMAQFVPQPVLAGFMNGVAVLILVPQIPTLLGLLQRSAQEHLDVADRLRRGRLPLLDIGTARRHLRKRPLAAGPM